MKLFDKYHVLKAELFDTRKEELIRHKGEFVSEKIYVFESAFLIDVNGLFMKVQAGDRLELNSY